MPSPTESLLRELAPLRQFNPDTAFMARATLLRLADAAGPAAFPAVATFARELLEAYAATPWKRAEQATVQEWLRFFERAAVKLDAAPTTTTPEPEATQPSVGLVPLHAYSPRHWCQAHASGEIPQRVLSAMDAARNRNRLVGSLLEPLFTVLQRLDLEQAWAWELAWLEEHRGTLDPDLVRDLLLAWEELPSHPPAIRMWLLAWSGDDALARQWPRLSELADAQLRRLALQAWVAQSEPRRATALTLLHRRVTAQRWHETEWTAWLTAAVAEIGAAVQLFVDLSRHAESGAELEPWRRAALVCELQRVSALYAPVLLLADLLLRQPSGASRFAMAFFGLGRDAITQWRARAEELARKNMRRLFLIGLRTGEKTMAIIERLSFGDATVATRARMEINLATLEFDSVNQRENVIRLLATNYLNRREEELLAVELRRRFRDLMRLLHPDNLVRVLPDDEPGILDDAHRAALAELTAIATAARRFLARRRNLNETVEERVTADLDFCQTIAHRRHAAIRRLLNAPGEELRQRQPLR